MMSLQPNLNEIDNREELEQLHYALLEEERRRGLDDLYFMCKHILGYKDMVDRTHKPVCDFLADKTRKKKHIQLPRGTFKSSVATIGNTIQDIAKDPDVRILIDNEVYGNSKAFLREIKSHLDSARLIELYPHIQPNKQINDGFTESSVIVKGRTRPFKEPTVSCAGLDQIKIGMHYDKIVMDDLVSDRNCTTREQMQKVVNHYRLALSLLEPEGELIIIGTRYHYSDLYGFIMENEYDKFFHMIIPAVLNKESSEFLNKTFPHLGYAYKNGDLFFPERLTESFLKDQRSSQGTYIFSCQYMLDPVDKEDADFSKEWFQYYRGYVKETSEGKQELVVEWVGDHEKSPLPDFKVPFTIPLQVYTAFDPANKKRKKSDFTAAVTVGIDPHGNWFILNLVRDKYNPRQIVDTIIHEHDRFNSVITGVEEEGKESIKFYLVERMKILQKFFKLRELKSGGVKKEDRITRLVPKFENRAIFMPVSIIRKNWEGKTSNLVDELEDELIYFPKAKHDDMIDALAYIEDLIPRRKGKLGNRRKGRAKMIG